MGTVNVWTVIVLGLKLGIVVGVVTGVAAGITWYNKKNFNFKKGVDRDESEHEGGGRLLRRH